MSDKTKEQKEFEQQYKEYFEKKRKSNDGVGFLFNNFFGDADDSFIDHVSGQMAKGAFMAKLLADKIKSADQSPRVKQELSEALKTAVAAMKTKNMHTFIPIKRNAFIFSDIASPEVKRV